MNARRQFGLRIGSILERWAFGDMVETALSSVGVTSERVEKWLGKPCGCKERRDKMNALGLWARRVLTGKKENAEEYLLRMMAGENPEGILPPENPEDFGDAIKN